MKKIFLIAVCLSIFLIVIKYSILLYKKNVDEFSIETENENLAGFDQIVLSKAEKEFFLYQGFTTISKFKNKDISIIKGITNSTKILANIKQIENFENRKASRITTILIENNKQVRKVETENGFYGYFFLFDGRKFITEINPLRIKQKNDLMFFYISSGREIKERELESIFNLLLKES